MPQYAALIEYDGTAYHGFQRQIESQPTIQGRIEQALSRIVQQSTAVAGAGRTDQGVHARGQVISFTTEWQHGPLALQRAINAHLPDDIAVLQLKEIKLPFHPRFDARRRAYIYQVYNAEWPSPLQRQRSWHVRRPLQVAPMNTAAQHLVGVHDFATFGQPPQGENSIRQVFAAAWERRGKMLTFTVEANAFLNRMVRSLVGSLKLVGEGAWTVEAFVDAFHACERSRAGMTAPPQGLYLISVTYEHDELNW